MKQLPLAIVLLAALLASAFTTKANAFQPGSIPIQGFKTFAGSGSPTLCLDIANASVSVGAGLISNTCNSKLGTQSWVLSLNPMGNTGVNGYGVNNPYTGAYGVTISPALNNNLCVEIANNDYSAGVIQLNICNGSYQQQWDISSMLSPAWDSMFDPNYDWNTNLGSCMGVAWNYRGAGEAITLQNCTGDQGGQVIEGQLFMPFGFSSNPANPPGAVYLPEIQTCGTLLPGEMLPGGGTMPSCDGRFSFPMQFDGNVVLYQGNTPLWADNGEFFSQSWIANYALLMQQDGNLVEYYNGTNGVTDPIWASGTQGNPGAWFVVQDDGNGVIYNASGKAIWATNTCCR